jgi:hypothetical protein
MNKDYRKYFKFFSNRHATKSIVHELMLWLIFWGLYSLWAGYSPSYPKSNHSEPLFPLVILTFMIVSFFIFGDRNQLKLLIANSILSLILISGFLIINIYRSLNLQFPESWTTAGFLGSQYIFFIIQLFFLFLAILHIRYTHIRWKKADPIFKKQFYKAIIVTVVLLVFFSIWILFFVFAGHIKK